jgi:Tol biopolymer transport system component
MPSRSRPRLFVAAAVVAAVALPTAAAAADDVSIAAESPATTERVSVTSEGRQGNDISGRFSAPDLSADGLVVAFDSQANNLVANDGNGFVDVYAHDRQSGVTELISVSTEEVQANDDAQNPSVDGTGRMIAFDSDADNLVQPDRNQSRDVFVRDRVAGTTELVSVNDRESQGNASSSSPDITADGRYVAFSSNASNLVRGDTNQTTDIFVRSRARGRTERVNLASDGTEANLFSGGPSISDDGRYVAFSSFANNLAANDDNATVDVFRHDRVTGETILVSKGMDGTSAEGLSAGPSISADGMSIAFFSEAPDLVAGDDNGTRDVFVWHGETGGATVERVSENNAGQGANGQSSFSQRGSSSLPDISADGRYVSFDSFADNLIAHDSNGVPDAFRRDVFRNITIRVSVSDRENQANGVSTDTAISHDGQVVSFVSQATNLVRGDTNRCPLFPEFGSCPDVFVRDLRPIG